MTSWPARVWASTETRLPWVPEDTKSAASLPTRRAAISSSRRTVGSSSHTSSPTSARAIASRMAWVGSVSVSERRSTTSCMERIYLVAVWRRCAARLPQSVYGYSSATWRNMRWASSVRPSPW